MTTLLLARHGETDWNRERRWQGHADPPLNEAGRAQARALAERLAGDAARRGLRQRPRRARARRREIVAARPRPRVIADPRLREIDVGEWSGLTTPEIVERASPTGSARHAAGGDGWERRRDARRDERADRRVRGRTQHRGRAIPAARSRACVLARRASIRGRCARTAVARSSSARTGCARARSAT